MIRILIPFIGCVFLAAIAQANQYMTADEVKSLLTDKTFDGEYLPKNRKYTVYEAPDRTWFVNEKGQHCTTHPKWKNHRKWKNARCSFVLNAGNGEYQKYSDDGKHTTTFRNFRDGNQL